MIDGYQCGVCPPGYRGDALRGYDIQEAKSLVQVSSVIDYCSDVAHPLDDIVVFIHELVHTPNC